MPTNINNLNVYQGTALQVPVLPALPLLDGKLTNLKNKLNSQFDQFSQLLDDIEANSQKEVDDIGELTKIIEHINQAMELGTLIIECGTDYRECYDLYNTFMNLNASFYNQIPGIILQINVAMDELQKLMDELTLDFSNRFASRVELDVTTSIDWDEDPTVYQATTIAHGHLLCYKQRWKADGYSLGEVKYSMSLGPCQKKQIAILDWDRSETGVRSENTIATESFQANLSRDRDVNEIINGSIRERTRGGSIAATFGKSSGGGAAASGNYKGILFGAVGGFMNSLGVSGSFASQKSSRSVALNSMNSLRDRINQSASSIRSQRSTVVQSVSQSESVTAQTEVIANKNLCHSVNYLFFEILRHFVIEQELVDVQECLFIPMEITPFDAKKAMRWRETLEAFVPSNDLRLGFDGVENLLANQPAPNGILADETIIDFNGQLKLTFDIPLPTVDDLKTDDDGDFLTTTISNINSVWSFWHNNFLSSVYGMSVVPFFQTYFYKKVLARQLEIWETQMVPKIVRDIVDNLSIEADLGGGTTIPLELDVTQLTRYRKGVPLDVSLNFSSDTPEISRSDIKRILIRSDYVFPGNARVIVQSGSLAYRTDSLQQYLFRNGRIRNDLGTGDSVSLLTRLNRRELINPAAEELRRANQLLTHLNDNLETYHELIWRIGIDEQRRFMMLDGIKLRTAGGRSVASIVQNTLVDVVGNCLVMPVVPGMRIDPVFRNIDDLLDFYSPSIPPEPFRISLPTSGCFMEAVQGSCNSCEDLDYTKARFHGFECKDEPTAIQPLNTDTRRADPGDLQAAALPTNIVNFQTAPDAPAPTDLANLLTLLGNSEVFRDITGLDANQANALAALTKTADGAQAFGQMAADLVKAQMAKNMEKTIDTDLKRIEDQKDKGNLSDEEAAKLSKEALENKNKANSPTEDKSESGTESKTQGSTSTSDIMDKGKELINNGAKNVSVDQCVGEECTKVNIERDPDQPVEPSVTEEPLVRTFDFLNNTTRGKSGPMDFMYKIRRSIFSPTIANVASDYVTAWNTNIVNQVVNSDQKARLDQALTVNPGISQAVKADGSVISDTSTAPLTSYFNTLHSVYGEHTYQNQPPNPLFLAWHRRFLLEFEKALGMPLPYWNWYDNQTLPPPLQWSNLITSDAYHADLSHNLLGNRNDSIYLVHSDIRDFWNGMISKFENGTSFHWTNDFEKTWEKPHHDHIHGSISGKMGDIMQSPFDPVFWLHHCYVDKWWSDLHSILTEEERTRLYTHAPMTASINGYNSGSTLDTFEKLINSTQLGMGNSYIYEGLFRTNL